MKSALLAQFRTTFGREPEFIARAPGRIEVIGNHTDYNGGVVLGAAIDRGTWVALASRPDSERNFASGERPIVRLRADPPVRLTGASAWANYPLGVLAALPHFGQRVPGGFDFLVSSDLPSGAGLSSSAALELASALVFLALTAQTPPRELLVQIAQHAENQFVGVPCGILDQGVSAFGRKDHLVLIDCRGPRFRAERLPARAHFWIFNTPNKHALVDGLYAERHRECREAAQALGVGRLAEVSPDELTAAAGRLGAVAYRRARHIVDEIARVQATLAALRRDDLAAVGNLLTASHRSSQTLFENSTAELDFLVDTLVTTPQIWGARLTGGGFGGAVMALASEKFEAGAAEAVASAYARRFGGRPDILHTQTGDGAALVPLGPPSLSVK